MSCKPMSGTPSKTCVTNYCTQMTERIANQRLWSVDECYFSEKVVPLYVYCKAGKKIKIRSVVKHWEQRTLLLAISDDGDFRFGIISGSCYAEAKVNYSLSSFRNYRETSYATTLRYIRS
jgi:hypothetical protein